METKTKKLKLAHLYPKLLNIYGDLGNILVLQNRCRWRNIELEIDEINVGDEISEHDIYFIGGGQDKQQEVVSVELQKHKTFLTQERDRNAVFLGICGGYQLMGHFYETQSGKKLNGAGILDVVTKAGAKRFIGNVTANVDFLEPKTLVGFENHSGLTYLNGVTKPIAKIEIGNGNNEKDKTEGAWFKNAFGTYLHGSLLPKNPHFADYLIKLALEKRYGERFELEPLNDDFEIQAHNSVINKSY